MAVERNRGSDGTGLDWRLARLAARQHGVVSHRQLRRIGWTSSAIQQRVETGRLLPVFRGVYAVGHDAIGGYGRHLAAVLACGPGSALSHLSAAALWGLRDPVPAVIDVIVPCETGRKIDGIRAHRCRAPAPDEVTVRTGIPCTTPARTLVDVAGTLGMNSLKRVVEQAAVLRLLDIAALDAAMIGAKGRRGLPVLRAIVDHWRTEDSTLPLLRSPLEAKLLSLVVAAGLPRPRCNHLVQANGRELEVDLLWPRQHLVVEADGYATHGTKAAFERDPRRTQDLMLAGHRVLRFTWDQVEREPERTVATIRRMLRSREKDELARAVP